MRQKAESGAGFRDFVLGQLAGAPAVECRPMFGGHGLYAAGRFFGILYRGRFYLRTDDVTRPRFIARGMKPFQPDERVTLKAYYEAPADVLEDREQLARWASEAMACAPTGENDGLNRTPAAKSRGSRGGP